MSSPDTQDQYPVFNLYPTDYETHTKLCHASTLPIRSVMVKILQHLEKISLSSFEDFKSKVEADFTFDSSKAAGDFFESSNSLQKLGKVPHYAIVSSEDIAAVGQEALSALPSDSAYKLLQAASAESAIVFGQFDVVQLALHVLYYSRVIVPLGDPVIGYGINLDKSVFGRISVQLQNIARDYGADQLAPFILFNEWQVDGLVKMVSSIPDLQNRLKKQNEEIESLKADIAAFKTQSGVSSQYVWEV